MLKFALVLFIEIFMADGSIGIARVESQFDSHVQCVIAAREVAPWVISAECHRLTFA